MSTQKRKYELIRRLEEMGFTFEEAHQLRRIEMTYTARQIGGGNTEEEAIADFARNAGIKLWNEEEIKP